MSKKRGNLVSGLKTGHHIYQAARAAETLRGRGRQIAEVFKEAALFVCALVVRLALCGWSA